MILNYSEHSVELSLMDTRLRDLRRIGFQDPEQQVAWLREKIRSNQLSESMKRILCALGYEPMVLALGYSAKQSSAQKSYMQPNTFCNYKNGSWRLIMDHTRVAKYLCKKHWSRIMCQDLLRNQVMSMIYEIDGQARLTALRGMTSHFYFILAQQLRNKEVRDALIARLLNRLT